MSTAEKALAAIREYDRLMTAIAQNKADIGDGLKNCTNAQWVPDIYGNSDQISIMPDGKRTHLAEALDRNDEYGGDAPFPRWGHNTPEEIAEILSECPGCQKAYAAIQERKANRKKLGIVKRAMRMIGRTK